MLMNGPKPTTHSRLARYLSTSSSLLATNRDTPSAEDGRGTTLCSSRTHPFYSSPRSCLVQGRGEEWPIPRILTFRGRVSRSPYQLMTPQMAVQDLYALVVSGYSSPPFHFFFNTKSPLHHSFLDTRYSVLLSMLGISIVDFHAYLVVRCRMVFEQLATFPIKPISDEISLSCMSQLHPATGRRYAVHSFNCLSKQPYTTIDSFFELGQLHR